MTERDSRPDRLSGRILRLLLPMLIGMGAACGGFGLATPPAAAHAPEAATGGSDARQWSVVEITLESKRPCPANCYLDQGIEAVFTPPRGSRVPPVRTQGFLTTTGAAAGQTWVVRFTPTARGTWTYTTKPSAADPALRTRGSMVVGAPAAAAHGFLRRDHEHPHAFVHDDGTHFWMLGQTSYELVLNARFTPANARRALMEAKAHGFTKVRVLAFPWDSVDAGTDAPLVSGPFTDSQSTHAALDQQHFAALDRVVQDAQSQGLAVDLEIFTDNDQAFVCRDRCARDKQVVPVCNGTCPGFRGIGNDVDAR